MMDRHTGRAITRRDHIAQSIADILTTPVGARVLNRDYGSRLPDLVDSPANPVGRLRLLAATADAIARWEARVDLRACDTLVTADGKITLTMDLVDRSTGLSLTATVPVMQ